VLGQWAARFGVEIWAYGLLRNQVRQTTVPGRPTPRRGAVGLRHQRLSTMKK